VHEFGSQDNNDAATGDNHFDDRAVHEQRGGTRVGPDFRERRRRRTGERRVEPSRRVRECNARSVAAVGRRLARVGRLGVVVAAKDADLMRRSFRRSRVVLTATVAGVIAMFATAPHSGAISAPAPAFVTLNGEGAWTVHEEKVSLQNELETAA